MGTAETIITLLQGKRLPLQNEKELQAHLKQLFFFTTLYVEAEYRLDPSNIIDFLINGSVGVEVKIKGGKKAIYKQVERYAYFNNIQALILVTNRSMGFPETINGKPCFVINLGKAWL